MKQASLAVIQKQGTDVQVRTVGADNGPTPPQNKSNTLVDTSRLSNVRPSDLTSSTIRYLQRTIGNKAAGRMIHASQLSQTVIQRQPQRPPARQTKCPGSCHVHVEYYQDAFGAQVEKDVPSPRPLRQGGFQLTQREYESVREWLRSPDSKTKAQQNPQASTKLYGEYIKSDVAAEYEKHRKEFESKPNRKAKVITFSVPAKTDDPDWAKLKASEISAQQKEKTFRSLGLLPEIKIFPRDVERKEFVAYIEAQNSDKEVFGIIIQLPVPARLQGDVQRISPKKDLDALSLEKERAFQVPATSEGVVRVVWPFAQSGKTVAVIGGKGFVGKGVVDLLTKKGIKVGVFDQGDDLAQAKAYDIVVSAVGMPRVVKSEHLKPEHILVVDTGFIPESRKEGELTVVGDVEESAREIPQHITPVPGGTGPVEMAALMERAANLLGVKVRSWEVELRDGKLRAVFRE
jgi:methylenetetrahydrofolate dehydrogenase (NADP+)/methenyltetrahydrofolate cyclohydrolase